MFQIDMKSRKSIYEQVVDGFKELIMSGALSVDEKLPSVRDLSKSLTVNPNTVQKAYRELEYQGYVYSTSGLGTFVAKRDKARVDEAKLDEVKGELRQAIKELGYLGLEDEEIQLIVKEIIAERSRT